MNSEGNSGIIKTESVRGALDPYDKKADEHAKRYYGLVRSMMTDVNHIANNTWMGKNEIQNIKRYLFMDMHDLWESGIKRFDPDYMIAESWQRLVAGKEIKPHDLILLKHELEERELILRGLSQCSAHIEATKNIIIKRRHLDFMVMIKHIKKENNIVKCDFYPEDSMLSGKLSVDLITEKITNSTFPFGYEYCISHLSHARKALIEMSKNPSFPEERLLMWY